MQAPVGAEHPGLEACIELKTNKVVENEKQEVIFHKWVGRDRNIIGSSDIVATIDVILLLTNPGSL